MSEAILNLSCYKFAPLDDLETHRQVVAAACREALRIMVDEPALHERLWANTRRFKAELTRLGLRKSHLELALGDPATAANFIELRRITSELADVDVALDDIMKRLNG